jgi:hypothetical protein
VAGGDLHRRLHILGVAGNDDAHRHDLIEAGVGAVQHAGSAVKAHLALNTASQFFDQIQPGIGQPFFCRAGQGLLRRHDKFGHAEWLPFTKRIKEYGLFYRRSAKER